jgi:hypothetical protein
MRQAIAAGLGIGVMVFAGAGLLPWLRAPTDNRPSAADPSHDSRPGQRPATGDVVVHRTRSTNLLDALSTAERRLVVVDDAPAPFWGGTPGGTNPQRELRALTEQAQAVLVGRVAAIRSSVSADKTWLDSTLDLRVTEVLKTTDRSTPAPGDVLTLRLYGGRLWIGGKEVIARRAWAVLPEEDREYLYFLVALEDGSFLPFPETATFALTQSGLRRLGGENTDVNSEPMTHLTRQSATDVLKAAARVR